MKQALSLGMSRLRAFGATFYLLAMALPITAEETGSIRGFVRDAAGRPLPDATIVTTANGAGTESRDDGGYLLRGLTPGSHVLEARLPGYTVDRREAVAVVAGQTTEVPFTLNPVATPLDEIVVTSTFSIMRDEPVSARLRWHLRRRQGPLADIAASRLPRRSAQASRRLR